MFNLKYWIKGIKEYGGLFILGHIVPVNFIQDTKGINFGRDFLSLDRRGSYHESKIQNNPYWGRNVD